MASRAAGNREIARRNRGTLADLRGLERIGRALQRNLNAHGIGEAHLFPNFLVAVFLDYQVVGAGRYIAKCEAAIRVCVRGSRHTRAEGRQLHFDGFDRAFSFRVVHAA